MGFTIGQSNLNPTNNNTFNQNVKFLCLGLEFHQLWGNSLTPIRGLMVADNILRISGTSGVAHDPSGTTGVGVGSSLGSKCYRVANHVFALLYEGKGIHYYFIMSGKKSFKPRGS